MARTGSSSKFVPVNLNNSYGQTLPLSNGGASASSSLGRSRSFTSSYGGMVSLSRSTRVSSPSPSSASVSASSRASKLAVPRPMNLPSLRREHSGNDPTIALVGSSGSSGWTKQTGDEASDVSATRSDSHSTSWGNRPPPQDPSAQITDKRLPLAGRQSAYSPPGPGDASTHSTPVEKAVVFRGEDFPTLQAAAVPYSPSLPPPHRSRELLSKQQWDKRSEDLDELKQNKERASRDDPQQSNCYFDQQFQPAQPVRMQVRGIFPEHNDVTADKVGAYARGPSPLVKLTHTSNWADDERETLTSLQPQESALSDWAETTEGFRSTRNWQMDHNGDIDSRRPTPRTGYPIRNDADSSVRLQSPSRNAYGKDGDLSRGPLNGGGRFELDSRGAFDRMNNSVRKNDLLKRGWSFSAAESNLNRDGKFSISNNGSDRENSANGKAFFREGNNVRHDTAGGDMLLRDVRPGFYYQDAGQRQESKFGKDILLGRQGFPGGVSPGPRTGRGPGFSYNGPDAALPSKQQPEMDYRRDRRASGFYGHVHDDPFLGDGISTRPTSLYALQPRIKKNSSKDHDYRDPARESFEAELERVEKMLEQERQRAAEERERASELVRKEQEEQERLAREEEEMQIKLEQEAREAAYRAQIEAEDAARRGEEARKAREDEKRVAELEEERRKEAARKKLLELEERMAKRESERMREDALQTERGSVVRTMSPDASTEHQDNGRRSTDMSREYHWKSGKVNEDDSERFSSIVPLPLNSSALPSILRSPRLSPYSKEENSSPSVEGARLLQTWKREPLDSGHDFRSVQKGVHITPHFENDRSQQEHEDRQWGSSFRNVSVRKSMASTDTHSRPIIDPDTTDERNWWVRGETPNKCQHPVEAYPTDASEYPSFGRLRQSLPKQPRVLPPPPGPTSLRKQFVQRDDTHPGASAFDTERIEMAPIPKEELSLASGESTVSRAGGTKESLVSNIPVSEQFDSVPSEEVVLSDAGSQFSDDTVEELVTEAYQEQELHSDAVSETYTEGEVDEISDITEAQESSEDLESQKPNVWEACTGEEKVDDSGETLVRAGKDNLECFQEQHDAGREGFIVLNKKEEEEKIENECAESERDITSSSLVEDVANANVDNVCGTQEAETLTATQSVMASGFKDERESVGNTEELASENVEQDQEIQAFPYQVPFLPVVSGDATQLRHLESVSSRQSLVQQFQQPFSFMAVPLPQSSTLNHIGASVPMLTPVHGLPNQQDLPFHLQLGLLPGVPLMPNAIQIGSIQMPLHIHPQIPQLAHVHGQQAPVFQFGQIGPTLPMSQPIPMTHVSQPAVQMHHAIGQVNVTQQHLQADFPGALDTKNVSVALNQHAKFGDVAADGAPLLSGGRNQAFKEDVKVKQMASTNSEGSRIPAEREVQHPLEEVETHSATVSVSKLEGQKPSTADTFESSWNGDRDQAELNARPGGKPSRGGRRRAGAPRYQGILGRGRGRFNGGQNHFYQAPHSTSENWPEGGPKRFARGKMIRRNYRRAEYRVREPSSNFDGESAAAEFPAGPPSSMEDTKEAGGYRYVKKGPGSQAKNVSEETGQFRSHVLQTTAKEDQPMNQSAPTPTLKTNSLLKKYEMDNAKDAPFRTGVVCVFEQPGIETPNDKDDFIKVRSKRQLLRELKEQREKESKGKGTDSGSRDQVSKKQQRLSTKTGNNIGMAVANSTKNTVKRRPTCSAESATTDGKVNTPSLINGATGISSAAVGKRNLAPPKPGRAISASKVVATGMEGVVGFAHENQNNEQLPVAAWGGQRSNQEVVSLTQIQLEEAMKPFRLDAPFSESAHLSEKVLVPLEPGLSSSSALVAVEKPVITSGPLSSLLAGEKIQFGAVTSPTPIPSNSRASTPISTVRTGSPLGFGMDSSHMPDHSSSFVTNFLEPPLDATFSSKGGSMNKDDGFEGKVVDLELEAEAAAAASAVVAAAISSEDLIESHTNLRVADMNATLTSANPLTVQMQSNSVSDNPMAVALPADLSVETPPSLFQGSSMGLSNMSGVMLQSLPGGGPAFPCLEMGPLLGGPVFNFGPREDASLASIEPGISGWQQRHVGTPDSFYGAPPFLSPAGISSIQGHPHMLVYANPYTPVGQFGQLGVSFMGTAYHPSGKQPDWTHIPMSSASSGGLALNNGDLSAGSNGPIASQHLNGPRTGVAGSSVMSVAVPPNLFDAGLAAPFQVPQMDGFVQSHWSKAPAPPGHSVPISGSSLPSQNFPLSKPAVDFNMQIHSSRVFPNQAMHPTHSVDASSVFHKPPVLNPASSSSFSSADAGAQFPDELGLGDSMPTVNALQSDAGGPLTEASHANILGSVESTGIKMRGRRPARSSQGNLSGLNSNTGGELISAANFQEQSRSGDVSSEFQSKNVGRIGTPSLRTGLSQFAEQKASKQGLLKESAGSEWPRGGSQRKGASGRAPISDRGGSVLPSKLKQIYVAKPAADGRKLSAACS